MNHLEKEFAKILRDTRDLGGNIIFWAPKINQQIGLLLAFFLQCQNPSLERGVLLHSIEKMLGLSFSGDAWDALGLWKQKAEAQHLPSPKCAKEVHK